MDPGYLLTTNGRCCSAKVTWGQTWRSHNLEWKNLYVYKSFPGASKCKCSLSLSIRKFPKKILPGILGLDCKLIAGGTSKRGLSMTVDAVEKDTRLSEENGNNSDSSALADISGSYFGQPIDQTELESIRVDSIRAKLIRKLSEANQYNRHLKRQVYDKEQALIKCKNELAVMELELQALVRLAQEVARYGTKPGSRKINGKYIHSHLALRLEEFCDKLQVQIKDVDVAQFREVPLVFYGMAENVQVMGSFDGWIQGEQLSPESTGSFTKFSTTLKLRPGQYEIKFLVDGAWQVSPELPTVGEGLMVNNLLVVE